jgi:hypothetical protein
MPFLRVAFAVIAAMLALAAVIRQPVLRNLPYESRDRSDAAALRRHVIALTQWPHSADQIEGLDANAQYVERHFRAATSRVEVQEFDARKRRYRNVIARFGPEEGALLVIGAHYDAFSALPGADDNASGNAGLLEIARLLGHSAPSTPIVLVAYANEEPPFFGSDEMGSAVHANSIMQTEFIGMISLEMIGYYTATQPWPNVTFELLYPSRGDFIAVGGGWRDRALTRHVKRAISGAGRIEAYSFTGPRQTLDASDHRNYWSRGWPAVLVTDTAYLRNPNYHTRNDTADTLDYVKMAAVVDGVFNAAMHADRLQ